MWAALAAVHLQKRPGARFNAYDDLFSIRKQEDESLQSLMNRVDTAIHRIQDLRPKDFTLSNLDDELASMTLIRSLTEEYSAFCFVSAAHGQAGEGHHSTGLCHRGIPTSPSRFYWLRDAVNDKMITPSFVPTTEQVADILTKPLPAAKVEYCRRMMGIYP